MKPKMGREIALLTLPIVIIGGMAWLLNGKGRALLPKIQVSNPFDPGPIRLEFSPFEKIEPTPLDVYQGFGWVAKTTVQIRGKWDVPKGWKLISDQGFNNEREFHVVFRKAKVWKQAIAPKNGKLIDTYSALRFPEPMFKVNLTTVPTDAEEVRLRGKIQRNLVYRGTAPPGWKPPKNLESQPSIQFLTIESKPFDIQIKGVGEKMPKPSVSHQSDLEVVDAKWFYRPFIHTIGVLLRDKSQRGVLKQTGLRVLTYSLKDARGKAVILFEYGSKKPRDIQSWSVIWDAKNLPADEYIALAAPSSAAPDEGWDNVLQPIHLDAKITDGISWPLTVRATLRQQTGDRETWGQAPLR